MDEGRDAVHEEVRHTLLLRQAADDEADLARAGGLAVVGLDDLAAGVVLGDQAGEARRGGLPLGGPFQVGPRHAVGDEDAQRHEEAEERGQRGAVPRHEGQGADHAAEGGEEAQEAVLERLRDAVQVVRHAAQHLAGLVGVEVGQGQAPDLLRDAPPQVEAERLRDGGHEQDADPVEGRVQRVGPGDPGKQAPQRVPREGEGALGAELGEQGVDEPGAEVGRVDGGGAEAEDGDADEREAKPLGWVVPLEEVRKGLTERYTHAFIRVRTRTRANAVLPAGRYVCCYVPDCNREGAIASAYAAMLRHCEAHGETLVGDAYEEYLVDEVCSANPKDWLAKLSIRLD